MRSDRVLQAARAVVEPLENRTFLTSAPLDPGFGPSGTGVAYLGVPHRVATAMYPDGRILSLAHRSITGIEEQIEFFRESANGIRDAAFGVDGCVATTFADHANLWGQEPVALAIQSDGKIVVSGSAIAKTATGSRFAVARYNADGTPDLSFGVGGYVVAEGDDYTSECTTVLVQPDGRILAVGTRYDARDALIRTGPDFEVRRYTPQGSPDRTFGTRAANGVRTGRVSLDMGRMADHAEHVALQTDGSILVGGRTTLRSPYGEKANSIVRYTPSGDIDRTFAGIHRYGQYATDTDLALAPDGSILVGYREQDRVRVIQYEPGMGSPRAEAALFLSTDTFNGANIDLAITPAQKVVVLTNDGKDWLQARFLFHQGKIATDTAFGTSGWQFTDFGPNQTIHPTGSPSIGPYEVYDVASNVFVQPDGGVVISGHAMGPGATHPVLTRFLDTGTIAGNVFADVGADGVRNTGDYLVSGFRVFLDRNGDGWWNRGEIFTRTNDLGRYTLTDVPAGLYWLRVTHIGGWRFTTNDAFRVRVTPGGEVIRHFGVTRNVLILGSVFLDADKSGGKDAGEAGLAGWTVFVDEDRDGVLDPDEVRVRIDAAGRYAIRTLAGGPHRIRVVGDSAYRMTAPGAGFRDVSLLPGQMVTGVNFGQERIA